MKFKSCLLVLLLALIFTTGSKLKAADKASAPSLADLNATCKPSEMPLQSELVAWQAKAQQLQTAADAKDAKELPLQVKVELALHKSNQITWPLAPEKVHLPANTSFGGVALLKAQQNGLFKIALSQKAWIDLVDTKTKQALKATRFEKQTGCSSIVKVIEFSLQSEHSYFLQISSTPKDTLSLLISPEKTSF